VVVLWRPCATDERQHIASFTIRYEWIQIDFYLGITVSLKAKLIAVFKVN